MNNTSAANGAASNNASHPTPDWVTPDLFAFRVRGNSLAGAAIIEGDILICQPAQVATTGEIVVVEERGERTAKRYRLTEAGEGQLETDPQGGEPEIVFGADARIIGVVKLIQRIPTC